MKNFLPLLTLTAGTIVLAGCTLNPMSSNTDDTREVTVDAQTTGALVYQSISEAQIADNLLSMANPAPENLLEQPSLPSMATNTRTALTKKTAATGITIDTVDGKIRITSVTPGLLSTRYDTIEVLMDETVFDAIEGNESVTSFRGATVNIAGTIDYYKAEDRDGDGIINGKSGTQRAALMFRTVCTTKLSDHGNGEESIATLEAAAGADNNFDTQADNLLYSASWVRLNDGDTIAFAFYSDADGDGVISTKTGGVIDVRFYESGNPLKPLVEYGKATIRLERDANGNDRTARFSAEEKLITGRLSRVWVVDASDDSTISAGEMAFVHFATNSPSVADSEITAEAVYTIDPGNDLGNVSDNTCKAIYLAKSFRFGKLDSMEFTCTFDPAVPHGKEPTAGSFELKAMYRNGKTATLEGTFRDKAIEGTYTGLEGNVTEVILQEGADTL